MTKGNTYIAIRTVGKDSAGHYVYSAWRYYKKNILEESWFLREYLDSSFFFVIYLQKYI